MRLLQSFILISLFCTGCAVPETAQMRTGVVGSDGRTVLWDQPVVERSAQFVDALLRAGSAYCTGYANTYSQQPHGQALVITPGGPTSFIYY
jgi:hypothetical protein